MFTASSEKTKGAEGVDVVVYPGKISSISGVASDTLIGGIRYFGITEATLPIFFEDQILHGKLIESNSHERVSYSPSPFLFAQEKYLLVSNQSSFQRNFSSLFVLIMLVINAAAVLAHR